VCEYHSDEGANRLRRVEKCFRRQRSKADGTTGRAEGTEHRAQVEEEEVWQKVSGGKVLRGRG